MLAHPCLPTQSLTTHPLMPTLSYYHTHTPSSLGDDFYRGGDYRSALNVYSAAIDADDHMVACYANRSACYLKLDMLTECRLDCQEGRHRLGDVDLMVLSMVNASCNLSYLNLPST